MEKGKLIESIRQAILRQQPVQDSNKHAHFLSVEAEVGKAYNSVLKEFYQDDKNLENAELDFFAKKYDCAVKKLLGVYYVDLPTSPMTGLPVKPIQLKRNLGMRSVKPKSTISGTVGFSFIRTSETEIEIVKDLEVYCCSKKAFYYIDGTRIVLDYPVKEYNLVEMVVVKLLPHFEDFAMTDNIEFPMGESKATEILMQMMGIRVVNNLNANDAK
jgi:hypothetical protein